MQLSVLQKFNNPEILFGFGQIHSFLFKLKIYMRDCFTVNLMYAVYFCPPNKMICSVDMEMFAAFKLEKVFALKSLSPRHCLRAQLPSSACRLLAECCPDGVSKNKATTCSHWKILL